MYSAPCGYPRFSAAIDGSAIQSCSIFTVWACWPAILAITSSFGDGVKTDACGPMAKTAAVAAAPWRNSRRLTTDSGFGSMTTHRGEGIGVSMREDARVGQAARCHPDRDVIPRSDATRDLGRGAL